MNQLIYTTQQAYRQLLDSLARPGRLHTIEPSQAYGVNIFDQTLDVLQTLLDGEVSFHLVGNDTETVSEIELRTLANETTLDEAEFIIVPESAGEEGLLEALTRAKRGTIISPEKSSSLIIEVSTLSEGSTYRCQGPGIESTHEFQTTLPADFTETLMTVNEEFPRGIDLYLLDGTQILGLSRTTKIEEVH